MGAGKLIFWSPIVFVYKHVLSIGWYVIQSIQNYLKLSTTKSRIEKGPKGKKRHYLLKFGIVRKGEPWGRRRIHITSLAGKESSLISELKYVLSGAYENSQLLELKKNTTISKQSINLSKIMSDPKFIIGCWLRIRSKKKGFFPIFTSNSLDGIKLQWFINIANSIRNGLYKFEPVKKVFVFKSDRIEKSLTSLYLKDKIIEEAIKYLLEVIYEPKFLNCSVGWRTIKCYYKPLNNIKKIFNSVNWVIECNASKQILNLDNLTLLKVLEKDINDQPFIDLIFKYIKTGFVEKFKENKYKKMKIAPFSTLSHVLVNIYIHPFDQWVINLLKKELNIKEYKKISSRSTKSTKYDQNSKQVYYIRHADYFLIGVIESKENSIEIKKKIIDFFSSIKLELSFKKIKILNTIKNSIEFLGYQIYLNQRSKQSLEQYKNIDKIDRQNFTTIVDAPIHKIVNTLILQNYAKSNGNPTRNGGLIHLDLENILLFYKDMKKYLLDYYSYSFNYSILASRIHFILKYSCALTIANKMKLKTLRETFKKYGKNLSIKNCKNKFLPNK